MDDHRSLQHARTACALDMPTISSRPPTNPLGPDACTVATRTRSRRATCSSRRASASTGTSRASRRTRCAAASAVPGSAGVRVAGEHDRELGLRARATHVRRGRTRSRAGVHAATSTTSRRPASIRREIRLVPARTARSICSTRTSNAADAACDAGLRPPVRQRLRRNARGDLHARAEQLLLSEPEHRRAHGRGYVRPHDLRDGIRPERHAHHESRQHAVQGGRHLRRQESVEGLFVPDDGAAQEAVLNALEASAAYTHGHSYSVQDITSSTAASNFRFGRELSGNLLSENTGISQFDIPNKVLIAGTYTAPWKTWQTNVSMIYVGISGIPFDYVSTGTRRGWRHERRRRDRQRSGLRAEGRSRSERDDVRERGRERPGDHGGDAGAAVRAVHRTGSRA